MNFDDREVESAPADLDAPDVPRARIARISLLLLALALFSVGMTPVGIGLLPERHGWDGLGETLLLLAVCLGTGASLALASLVTGVLAASHRRYVLWWVVPLWVTAAVGSGAAVLSTVPDWLGPALPAGKLDEVMNLLGLWWGLAWTLGLARWLLALLDVLPRGARNFVPWWSVLLWAALPSVALLPFCLD